MAREETSSTSIRSSRGTRTNAIHKMAAGEVFFISDAERRLSFHAEHQNGEASSCGAMVITHGHQI